MAESIDFQDIVIQRIKKLREDEGINQSKLGKILGISRGQMSNIENPNYPHKYTLKQIVTICKTTNCPIEKILMPEKNFSDECSKAIEEITDSIVRYV